MNDYGNTQNDYSLKRVPVTARVNLLSVTLVRMGMATSLTQFMIGATLGHSMTFWQAMLATLLGSLILEIVSLGLGIAGMREGLPTSLLARWCGFGRIGAALIGLTILISLLGWFGVQNSILAKGVLYVFDYKISLFWISVFCGVILTLLVAFGFGALSWTANFSVPLFFLVVGWILFNILQSSDATALLFQPAVTDSMTLGEGITLVSGGIIIGALITPDYSRYCQSEKHVFWMITCSIIVGEFIINGIAILVAHVLNTSDVVTIMTHSAGWIGLLSVILSAVKVNDVNLYSSSLSMLNFLEVITGRKYNYVLLTIALGLIGTLLSAAGILESFIPFLVVLGVIFPPIAGVMLVDYYILRTSRGLLDITRRQGLIPDYASTPLIGCSAIVASVAGATTGLVFNWGIPALNSIIVAGIFYWVVMKLRIEYKIFNAFTR